MTFNLLRWTITIEKKHKKYIIDDIFKLIPTTDPFELEHFLEQVMKSRGEFKTRDVWFLSNVGIIEQELLTYNLAVKQGDRLILTDSGRLAKDLGGFTEHLKYHYCPTKIALKSQSFIGGIDKKLSSDLKG